MKKDLNKNIQNLILTDMDGTLTKTSVVLEHAVFLFKEGVINLDPLKVFNWVNNPKDPVAIDQLADHYAQTLIGETPESISATEFMDTFIDDPKNFNMKVFEDILNTENSKVFVISGSPTYLLESFGKKFGWEIIGANYFTCEKGSFNGERTLTHLKGFKSEAIENINVDYFRRNGATVKGYGDTIHDEPLFSSSDVGYLINPNNETSKWFQDSSPVKDKVHTVWDL